MLRALLVVVIVVVVTWVAFLAFVVAVRPRGTSLTDAARLLPDTVRLVHGLAGDRAVPRRARWLLWCLVVYLASPIDLVPDFLPVIGYADDVIVTAFVLRRVLRVAGSDAMVRHWRGSPDALRALQRLLRLPATT